MNRVSAPDYDRFKTIVAVVLVVILILMLLRGCATNAVPSAPAETSPAPISTRTSPTAPLPTSTVLTAPAMETATPSPASPTLEPTITPVTASPTTTVTETTLESPATPTLTAAVTETTPETGATSTATPMPNAACNTSVPSRLSVGQKARVLQRLNMRQEASIQATLLQTNPVNTQVEIIGGPVCTPVGASAYLWWQIRLANGSEGWSAESQLNNPSYFLEPIP